MADEKHRRRPFDLKSLVDRNTSRNCFVCEFLSGNPDYHHVTVAETDTAIAFLNKYPQMFGYVLMAPKAHKEEVTGSFSADEYLELQAFIYRVSEAMRAVLEPERVYILSVGSKAANSHVHWHLAPLPRGVPLEEQQYHALMHENGVVEQSEQEIEDYVRALRQALSG